MLASGTTIFSPMVVRLLAALSVLSAVQCQSYPCPENKSSSASVFEVPQHKTYCWYRVILQGAPTQQETKYFLQVSKSYQQCCIYDPKTSCTTEFACFYSYWIRQKGLEEVKQEMLRRIEESLNPYWIRQKGLEEVRPEMLRKIEQSLNPFVLNGKTRVTYDVGSECRFHKRDNDGKEENKCYKDQKPSMENYNQKAKNDSDQQICQVYTKKSSETEAEPLTADTVNDEMSETTFILLVVALVVTCVIVVGLIYVVVKRKKHQKERRNKNGKFTEHSVTSDPSSTTTSTGNEQKLNIKK